MGAGGAGRLTAADLLLAVAQGRRQVRLARWVRVTIDVDEQPADEQQQLAQLELVEPSDGGHELAIDRHGPPFDGAGTRTWAPTGTQGTTTATLNP